ncbi:MAG TPA: MMPL family transporter [Dehalococcoidia bacterium]|nr:MMPL family transporter [Dehalococcoidia bacterium]
MREALSPGRLARWCATHRWTVVAIWAAALVAAAALAFALMGSGLTHEQGFDTRTESQQAEELLEQRLRGPEPLREIVIVRSESLAVDDPAYRSFVEGLYAGLMALGPDVVSRGLAYYQPGGEGLVSADRHTALIVLTLAGEMDGARERAERVRTVVRAFDGQEGFQVLHTGQASVSLDSGHVAERDLRKGEGIGIPAALAVLLLVFGAVVAAVMPIVFAVVAIVIAVGLAVLVGQAFPLTFFVTNMITMMGLAVGIDYCLFIISRYREERARGLDRVEAIAATGDSASRAVLFSGLTVIIAMSGLLIVPTSTFRSLAIGSVLVVAVAVLASLTLVPALLGLLGDRVNSLRVPFLARFAAEDGRSGFWDRVARTVMRRPALGLVLVGGLLLALTVPYFQMETGLNGAETLPDDLPSKQGFSALARDFPSGLVGPAEVVIDGDVTAPEVQAAVQKLQTLLAADPTFGPPSFTANPAGDLGVLSVPIAAESGSREAVQAVDALRQRYVPEAFAGVDARVLVGGEPALARDFLALAEDYTPIVFAFVLGLSFVLLTLAFRSLVVPAKAVLMNLLSVGAAYGLTVLVFQRGWGADLLGFRQVEAIEAWIPVFLFAVLFGLSMDYHVFLLSRIRERYDETGDNSEAVSFGLRTTGKLITGAALIMAVVFAGFASGELVMFQQVGFSAAVAVLLDATLVRSVLVPSSMALLGRWNWWLPRWLSWLPDLRVEPARRAYATVRRD